VRNLWEKLGSDDAISWISVPIVGFVTVFGAFVLANVETQGRELLFLTLATASILVVALVLLLGKQFLIRTTRVWLRPIVTVTTFAIALVLRAFTFDALLVVFAFSEQQQVLQRLVASLFTVGGGLVVSAYLGVSSREIVEKRKSLESIQKTLEQATREASMLLASKQTQLIEEVRALISSKLISADSQSNRLKGLLDDVVRPVSHRLFREFESVLQEPKVAEVKGFDWMILFREAMYSRTTYPLAFGVWLIWTSMNMLPALSPETGQFAAFVVLVMTLAILPLVELCWRKIPSSLSIASRSLVFTGLFATFDIALVFTLHVVTDISLVAPSRILSTLVSVLVAAWAVSLCFAGVSLIRQINLSLDEANQSLRREIAGLNGAAREFQERVSRLLHGPIQDTISKALYQAEQNNSLETQHLVAQVGEDINQLINDLNNQSLGSRNVQFFLGELVQLWDGVVKIETSLDETAAHLLGQNPITSGSVIEIVREGCSNAVRHGDASDIKVSISFISSTNEVQIEIRNDGAQLDENQPQGLGTQLFNQLCSQWSRTQVGTQVMLTCLVPLPAS
jgi:signal transduction histidine kinase